MATHAVISWISPGALLGRIDAEFYTPDVLDDAAWIERQPERVRPLFQCLSMLTDGMHETPTFVNEGPLYLTATNIDPCHLNVRKGFKCTNEKTYERYDRMDCAPREGDVLLSKSGRIGYAAVVPAGLRFSVLHSAAILRPHNLDPYFLAAFLHSRYGQTQISRYQKGAVQPMLHLEEIAEIRIPVCSSDIQRAIGARVRKAERLRTLAADIRSTIAIEIAAAYGPMLVPSNGEAAWVEIAELSERRVDAWFHQPSYLASGRLLEQRKDLVAAKTICRLSTDLANVIAWPSEEFPYFEIGGLNPDTGEAIPTQVRRNDAPSRAKYLVQAGDVLVSTVRPNLRAIGQVSARYPRAVCSSGFAVLRPMEPAIGAYVRACLVQDAATLQLMRWNTGATYPAIERSVPGSIRIPDLGKDRIREMGESLLNANDYTERVADLLTRALADVEKLVAGSLDSAALLDEGEQIRRWLIANPSPRASKETSRARNS